MKICESWLREWVNLSLNTKEISEQLTMLGLEVDALYPVAGDFSGVVVAKVLKTTKHPEANKLTICEVDDGTHVLQVVCGAANVRQGLKVALAKIGAKLPNDMIIKETSLRGADSFGMLCSASELGLEEKSEGILELLEDAPIGVDIREYLLLNDFVFDIDLTPNRADCLSVLGVARELAARNKLPLKLIPNFRVLVAIQDIKKVKLDDAKACAQYTGRIIKNINVGAVTPVWMKERLRRSGIRVLHPVVDIMNYVMLELGQPMHAFDLQTIKGDIHVRYAKQGEKITILGDQEINLDDDVLVIADDNNLLAMAGIMGGKDSSVQELTKDIFLESAFFNPVVLANIARRYGLSSDSSQRYERGVDPALQEIALDMATALILEIAGGQAGIVTKISDATKLPSKVKIAFNPEKVLRLTGVKIPYADMFEIFKSLGMEVEQSESTWQVSVPSYRFDIKLEVDLVEEVIRLYGFDKIPEQNLKHNTQLGNINFEEQLLLKTRLFLSSRGYHEAINYSFVDPNLQQELYPDLVAFKLINPISEELSEMRVGMWPGLLASMLHNIHRHQSGIKLFEAGVVFQMLNGAVREEPCIAGLISGEHGNLNWSESAAKYDFYDVKGDLEALFAGLGYKSIKYIAAEHQALHPGKSAKIILDEQEIGFIGVLHPKFMDLFDLSDEVVLFELSLMALQNIDVSFVYRSISKYPQTRRDLSFLVDVSISAMQIEKVVRDVIDASYLKSFNIFDVYTGDSIPENKKSVAIALTLQSDNRTLVDVEVNEMIAKVLKKLETDCFVELRAVI